MFDFSIYPEECLYSMIAYYPHVYYVQIFGTDLQVATINDLSL